MTTSEQDLRHRSSDRSRLALLAVVATILLPTSFEATSSPADLADATSPDQPHSQSTGYDGSWSSAIRDYAWSFPRDHWAHPAYKTEWWYLTGHLQSQSSPERWYGYQFTFFRFGLAPETPPHASDWNTRSLIMGHAAISDPVSGKHLFSEVVYREMPLLGGFGSFPDSVIAWSRGPAGTDASWTLRWNGEAFDFDMRDARQGLALSLSTRPLKPLVLQGPGGYSSKGDAPTQASQYYSFTRLATRGSLTLGGTTDDVRGESWMDKEFGSNQLSEAQIGWDWFSLQLQDGRELMLYALRDRSGQVDFASGTLVSPRGETRSLSAHEWSCTSDRTWISPRTDATYPSGWRIRVPSAALEVTLQPVLQAQENVGRSLYYWEGAVSIQDAAGQPVGRGYVELTGYGPNNRPPI